MEPNQKSENKTGAPDYSQVPTFFKYCSDDERVIRGLFKDYKIRFTQSAALNDPLEFNPIIRFEHNGSKYRLYIFDGIKFPSVEVWLRVQLFEHQLNQFGILSMTKIPNSFDMWSRYANGHKGFLIELKSDFNKHPCMLSKNREENPLQEVKYVDEYAVDIDEIVKDGFIPFESFNERAFFTKTSRWKDEVEYRMIRKLSDHPEWQELSNRPHRDRKKFYLFDFSLDCIYSVTFGASMSPENKKIIIDACKGTGIKFFQAIIIRDQKDKWGRPANVDLIQADSFPNLLEMIDFCGEQKNIGEKRKAPIPIENLGDLPYYRGNEQQVKEYFENRKKRKKGSLLL